MHHTYIGIKTSLGIFLDYAREAADLGIETRSCDLPDAVELAFRRDGKSGLDHIHTELVKLPSDLELLFRRERDTRSLLSIPKSGIKNAYPFTNKRTNVVENDSPQRFLVSWVNS
jgi:hypothetical protein